MIYIVQNTVPIAAATLVGLLIGLAWLRITGRGMPRMPVMALAVLAEFWLSAILAGALILAPTQAGVWTMTLGSAFVIWIGFVLPALAITLAAGAVRARTIASATAYWLVAMLAQAATMRLVGLTAPPA